MEAIASYQRVECKKTAIYIDPEKPDWFIPTAKADFILRMVNKGVPIAGVALKFSERFGSTIGQAQWLISKLLSRFRVVPGEAYRGRLGYRTLKNLKECWFHITNQCNMACKHCMFSSDPGLHESLPRDALGRALREALTLGCKVFYFTGGEPLVYQDFTGICNTILRKEATHIVVLTNGKNLKRFREWLSQAPRDRLHFQVSLDGLQGNHDSLRGSGSYQRLMDSLSFLRSLDFSVTLAMAVNQKNVQEMASIVAIAEQYGIKNIHFLWLFLKGKAKEDLFVHPEVIFKQLVKAYENGRQKGVLIDNMEILKSQVFSLPGTKFDLSNAAWESIAVGPDGTIYPSPALIGEEGLAAGTIADGLANVWKNSPVFERIRAASLLEDPKSKNNLFKYFVGGGDIDHSYSVAKVLVGADPYTELYNRIVLYLLTREAESYGDNGSAGILCRMGERLYECDEESASVGFTHSNCVLSLPGKDGYSSVKSFYSRAAASVHEEILNPVFYAETEIFHIPNASRVRSYGCGSPVLDCGLQAGETLVDLGSGAGVECFIAAKKVGPAGKVYGVDMLEEMLAIAQRAAEQVAMNLGYDNVSFRKGFLEQIPIQSETADVVISNCVINLSPDKRRTFSEIRRILKPGGRLCISDIVSEDDIPLGLKYDETLRGECIGGAMRADELFALLEDLGFAGMYLQKRFLYRQVKGYNFYSITYSASKPPERLAQRLLYRGPFAAVITDDGEIIRRADRNDLTIPAGITFDNSFFILDRDGNVTNAAQDMNCSCRTPPRAEAMATPPEQGPKYTSGCMVCGQEVTYVSTNQTAHCHYCGNVFQANTRCRDGHYVCDRCHALDALQVIRTVCVQAPDCDMIDLLLRIRKHAAFPLHGPEHHALVPGIILSVYKNVGGLVSDEGILTGIERGGSIVGGACSFLGICGAAAGVGIAFAVILGATPYTGRERQVVMTVTKEVMEKIAAYEAPRCCQRECWTALRAASELSEKHLSIYLPADRVPTCNQYRSNKECIGRACPLWSDTPCGNNDVPSVL